MKFGVQMFPTDGGDIGIVGQPGVQGLPHGQGTLGQTIACVDRRQVE